MFSKIDPVYRPASDRASGRGLALPTLHSTLRILSALQGESAVIEYAVLLIFPAAMAFAGAMDLFTMTIPNRISIVLVATFFVAAAMTGIGWQALASHVGAGLLMLAIGIGDAKLLAATALWLGFGHLLGYLMVAGLAGGLLALAILMYRSMLPPLWLARQGWALRLHSAKSGIPYGIALAVAGLHVYPSTIWLAPAGI
jgi:prepilin peptidase CpaA